MIEDWYLNKLIPNPEWMKNCYNKSFLHPQDAFNILQEMQRALGEGYFDNLLDYYEEVKKKEEERMRKLKELKQTHIDKREKLIRDAKQLNSKIPRSTIVSISYSIYIGYKDPTDIFNRNRTTTYEEYNSKMKKYTKGKILKDLLRYIESL